ncbi:BPTI domain-containing protein [Nocardia aurantia]|uniref:Uncharacterized protein n=1 Tax=Nocardia aurantia TaxID=2585199 RepID=A0A7K0DH48_9NOCA|nr:hypothetical protein [Nocardia aurantia]MQY24977.1 hypothetical protein [Nocardia aurantia]
MSASGGITDTTQWPTLLSNANDGSLLFDASSAQACITACQTLLGTIESLLATVTSLHTPSKPLITYASDAYNTRNLHPPTLHTDNDTIGSATSFRHLLQNKWGELAQRLRQHKKIVTDMGDTFAAAAKAYETANQVNVDNFHLIDPANTTPITFDTNNPLTPNADNWPNEAASGPTGVNHNFHADPHAASVAGEAEPGSMFNLAQFYFMAMSIKQNNPTLALEATQWSQLATKWNTATDDFYNSTYNTLTDTASWSGEGSAAALTAVDNYYQSAQDLGTGMKSIYTAESYLTDLFANLYKTLPQWWSDVYWGHWGGCSGNDNNLSTVQNHWNTIYVPALPKIAAYIPTLADPNKDTAAGATGEYGTGNPGEGTGSTGNGSGSSGNGSGSGNNNGGNNGNGNNGNGNSGSGTGGYSGSGGGDTGSGGQTGAGTGGLGSSGDSGSGGGSQGTPTGGGGDSGLGSSGNSGSSGSGQTGSGSGTSGLGSSGNSGSGGGSQGTPSDGSGGTTGGGTTGGGAGAGASGTASGASGFGASGIGVSGASGASGAALDLLSLFGDILQMLSSSIPGLEQLASQLLQQLPSDLQQLGLAYQNGMLTFQQAMGAAATEVGDDIQQLSTSTDRASRRLAVELGLAPAEEDGAPVEFESRAEPVGPTGPEEPGHYFPRASAPIEPLQPVVHDHVVAGTPETPVTPVTPTQPARLTKLEEGN